MSKVDTEHPGHPVRVFKEENLASVLPWFAFGDCWYPWVYGETRKCLRRCKGLVRQMGLVGQFDIHYQRKEELFSPSWSAMVTIHLQKLCGSGWSDQGTLSNSSSDSQVTTWKCRLHCKEAFEAFATEFESMIFKEESILLMILLESFTQDDWLQIAEESDAYGYAIIRPSENGFQNARVSLRKRVQRSLYS